MNCIKRLIFSYVYLLALLKYILCLTRHILIYLIITFVILFAYCMEVNNTCIPITFCALVSVVCPFGIYVHFEWTYVRWEFMSIPNGHMSVWNLCPFQMDMYVGLK